MARIKFPKENMPKTWEEFERIVKESMARGKPVDDLLELAAELHDYERQYGMTSTDFYPRYQRGEFGDDMMHTTMEWAIAYEDFLALKERIENTLIRWSQLQMAKAKEKKHRPSRALGEEVVKKLADAYGEAEDYPPDFQRIAEETFPDEDVDVFYWFHPNLEWFFPVLRFGQRELVWDVADELADRWAPKPHSIKGET